MKTRYALRTLDGKWVTCNLQVGGMNTPSLTKAQGLRYTWDSRLKAESVKLRYIRALGVTLEVVEVV
jgi:hypothetical protein